MPKFILALKKDMSRVFRDDGTVVPVTRLQAGPCVVTQVRTAEKDGYRAVQVGFGEVKKISKPKTGHLKPVGKLFRHLQEFRVSEGEYSVGQVMDVTQFKPGDVVKVTGYSKGHGFQGVVKRHGFHGHPSTHGHKDQLRMPGSIGAGGVQHVRKGMRMAGHMGDARVSVRGLEVVAVEPQENVLLVKGAVPGAPRSLVLILGI